MKTKLPLILAVVSAMGTPFVNAQDERPPAEPPPRDGKPSGEGDRPKPDPGERERRPERDRGPGRLDERGPGRPENSRRPEGDRAQFPQGENSGRDAQPRVQKPTPFIGVMTAPVPPALGAQIGLAEGFGVVVEELVPDSPAATAGVQRYDVLKAINDQQLVDPNQLAVLVRSYGKDREVSLTILRKGQEQKLTLKIGERMLPERRILSLMPSPGDFAPRINELRERGEDYGRRLHESMRGFQDRVRDFEKKVDEWRRNPGNSKPPEAPSFQGPGASPAPNAPQPPEPPRPADLLREVQPGGAPQVRVDQGGATTTWNTGQARILVKDEQGELEVRTEGGHRTVIAKNPAGEIVFSGPVDTDEQRHALPEPVRKSLEKVRVKASFGAGPGNAEVGSRDNAARPVPAPGRAEREVQ